MHREFVIRFEGDDLVCFLIVDHTDFVEIGREANACCGTVDDCTCQIDRLMQLAEIEHGGPLPWAFNIDDEPGGRVAWTGSLDPVRI